MSSPDPEIITRRLTTMRTLLDHLESLEIRSTDILTHEYMDVDKAILVDSIPRALRGYDSYVRTVAQFLTQGR